MYIQRVWHKVFWTLCYLQNKEEKMDVDETKEKVEEKSEEKDTKVEKESEDEEKVCTSCIVSTL